MAGVMFDTTKLGTIMAKALMTSVPRSMASTHHQFTSTGTASNTATGDVAQRPLISCDAKEFVDIGKKGMFLEDAEDAWRQFSEAWENIKDFVDDKMSDEGWKRDH